MRPTTVQFNFKQRPHNPKAQLHTQTSQHKLFYNLNILYFNTNSLVNKLDELKARISSVEPDIIATSETHFTTNHDNPYCSLSGYNVFRCDRKNGLHSGVALYFKSSISSYLIHSAADDQGEWESVWCCIQLSKTCSYKIGCCYRIPSSALPTHWPSFLASLNYTMNILPQAPTLIVGDFNFPTTDWKNMHTSQSDSSASYDLLEFIQDQDLVQHVTQPTRHRNGQRSSLLDLIISSSKLQIDTITHQAPLGRNDHDVLFFQLDTDFGTSVLFAPNQLLQITAKQTMLC